MGPRGGGGTLSKMSLLVGASDSLEASDPLGLGVKVWADEGQHRVLVIAATNPDPHPQNSHGHPVPSPTAQPHPMLMVLYGSIKIRGESASFISVESQENDVFRCYFTRPGESDRQLKFNIGWRHVVVVSPSHVFPVLHEHKTSSRHVCVCIFTCTCTLTRMYMYTTHTHWHTRVHTHSLSHTHRVHRQSQSRGAANYSTKSIRKTLNSSNYHLRSFDLNPISRYQGSNN